MHCKPSGSIRYGFVPWAAVELFEDRYNWDAVDKVVDAAAERGMAVLAAVTSTPRWASDHLGTNSAPRSEDDYAEFVTELAKRYGAENNGGTATIAAFEIWNEPNGAPGWFPSPDPEAYTRLLKAAYTAIKKVDKSTLVVAAGLGVGFSFLGLTINPVDFIDRMYDAGAHGYFDAIAVHPYQFKMTLSDGDDYPDRPIVRSPGSENSWTTTAMPTR